MPRLPHRSLVLTACLVTSITLAACSSDSETSTTADDTVVTTTTAADEETTTTDPPPPTTTAALTPEEEVEAAYLRAAEIAAKAHETSDPDYPGLAETRTGENLTSLRELLAERRNKGEVAVFPGGDLPAHHVSDIRLIDTENAELRDCFVDNGVLTSSATGEALNAEVTTKRYQVSMVREAGSWKIAWIGLESRTEDSSGCA